MGKFNRPSRTRNLEKLTAKLEGTAQPEAVAAKPEPIKEVKKTMQPKKPVVKKGDTIKVEVTPSPVPGPVVTPAPRVAEKPVEMNIASTPEQIAAMNVYQKVQTVRSAVADFDIKKSGSNSDKGFNYFELPDYLPMLNKLMAQIGLMTKFDMFADKGTLKIFNTAKPDEVLEFELPTADLEMADAEGKKAEGIQIMGGKTTYMRRYLMQIAFEISVKDTVDSRGKQPEKPVEELDPRDAEALKEASDIEHLNTIAHSIRSRKGFNKGEALLKLYTEIKGKLSV